MKKEAMRWDIINYLIEKNNYENYLEIGYYRGWSFDNVSCAYKTAVDPNPCKLPEWEKLPYGSVIEDDNYTIVKNTSDDFFDFISDFRDKYDVIFIDGLHESQQVERDIRNSLDHLSDNGAILIHDCNPPTYKHTTTGDNFGNWNGDVYKAILRFGEQNHFGKYTTFTIDSDWGIGIIMKNDIHLERHFTNKYQEGIDDWDYFDQHREELLNLISVEEFFERY